MESVGVFAESLSVQESHPKGLKLLGKTDL
jgi:hypothetical protein